MDDKVYLIGELYLQLVGMQRILDDMNRKLEQKEKEIQKLKNGQEIQGNPNS